jgi:hypothetical protein
MMHLHKMFSPMAPTNRFRVRRMDRVRHIIHEILERQHSCRIIDIGGLPSYWHCFAPDVVSDPRVSITLVNLSYDDADTALTASAGATFSLRTGDARLLDEYPDKSFDLAHSNSVIEHVGRWTDMCAMAAEVQRVGCSHFVQTPYWGFPIEPHNRTPCFHWLPEQLRYRLVMRFQLGFWTRADDVDSAMRRVQSSALLDRRQFAALFPKSSIYSEIVYGLTKSLVAIGGNDVEIHPCSNTRRLRI